MTLRYRYHPAARAELDGATLWYEDAAAGLGSDLLREVEAVLESILAGPAGYPLHPDVAPRLAVRRALLRRYPYSLVWLTDPAGDVVILAVAHTRRLPGYWLERVRQ